MQSMRQCSLLDADDSPRGREVDDQHRVPKTARQTERAPRIRGQRDVRGGTSDSKPAGPVSSKREHQSRAARPLPARNPQTQPTLAAEIQQTRPCCRCLECRCGRQRPTPGSSKADNKGSAATDKRNQLQAKRRCCPLATPQHLERPHPSNHNTKTQQSLRRQDEAMNAAASRQRKQSRMNRSLASGMRQSASSAQLEERAGGQSVLAASRRHQRFDSLI
ncbi:hypothetical protein BC831DRAFT_10111 [Entophlyctis helioformis]|nr:hypothetical protein BC831DRAFT_10111 [Entophlyctis helioformis]